jgi:hypothetical protein
MITGFSDRVHDAPIEKRLLHDMSFVFIAVGLGGAAFGATITSGSIKFE